MIKAFVRRGWIFYGSKGRKIAKHSEAMLIIVSKCKIKWKIQKNRQSGQTITFVTESDNADSDTVKVAYEICLHSIRLKQKDDKPMGVFVNKNSQVKYLTAAKIAEVLQKVIQAAHPDWTDDKVSKISLHLGRVLL